MAQTMAIGSHRFEIAPLSFNDRDRNESWRQPSQDIIGGTPVKHYTGRGTFKMTVRGMIFPNALGGEGLLEAISSSANSGRSMIVVSGTGRVYGKYVITSVKKSDKHIAPNAVPGTIGFTVQLEKDGGRGGFFGGLI